MKIPELPPLTLKRMNNIYAILSGVLIGYLALLVNSAIWDDFHSISTSVIGVYSVIIIVAMCYLVYEIRRQHKDELDKIEEMTP